MRCATLVTLCVLLGPATIARAQDDDRITLEPGFYTATEIGRRLSTTEHPVRVAQSVANRAALLSLHDRLKADALAVVCVALGLQAQREMSGRTITLTESSKLASSYRAWRNATMAALRRRVADLVRLGDSLTFMTDSEREAKVKELGRQIDGATAAEPSREMHVGMSRIFLVAATQRLAIRLAFEPELMWSTRPSLMHALEIADNSAIMRGAAVELVPVDVAGPGFMKILNEDYGGGLSWSNRPIDTCQIGWKTSLADGALCLSPVLTLTGNRFVHLGFQSEIGNYLPTEAAARTGLSLSQELFDGVPGGKPLLGPEAQAWYRPMNDASVKFLDADGADLRKTTEPLLSSALVEWAKATGKDIAMELSTASGVAHKGTTFGERFPDWRFHDVGGVLVAEDLMAFWHRGRPLPIASLVDHLGMSPDQSDLKVPTESQLRAFYRVAPPVSTDWYEVAVPPANYHGIDVRNLDDGRALLRAWDDLRANLRPQIKAAMVDSVRVPVAKLSEAAVTNIVGLIRATHPLEPDFYTDDFVDQFRELEIDVSWNIEEPAKKGVTLGFVPPDDGIGDTMLASYLHPMITFIPDEG